MAGRQSKYLYLALYLAARLKTFCLGGGRRYWLAHLSTSVSAFQRNPRPLSSMTSYEKSFGKGAFPGELSQNCIAHFYLVGASLRAWGDLRDSTIRGCRQTSLKFLWQYTVVRQFSLGFLPLTCLVCRSTNDFYSPTISSRMFV